jgi:hypothetical protein
MLECDDATTPRDIDITFFIATIDLWSGDGKIEQNLVLNTTAVDRPQPSTRRRRKGSLKGNSVQESVLDLEDPVAASPLISPDAPRVEENAVSIRSTSIVPNDGTTTGDGRCCKSCESSRCCSCLSLAWS